MTFSFRYCAWAVAIMTVPAVSPGQDPDQERVRAGEVELEPPAGWSREEHPGGRLVLKRTDDGQLSTIVVATEPLEGSLVEAVRSAMHRVFIDHKLAVADSGEGDSIFGYRGVSFEETFRHEQLRRRVRVSGLGLEVDGRLHLAWMATMANDAAEEREREFEQMIRTWRFPQRARAGWNPVQPRKVSADLAGFYWGSKTQNRYNGLSGMLEMKAVRRYVVLLPTGQAYHGIPPGGRVLDMDFAERVREDPARCGLYSVDGDEIVFEWPASLGMLRTERAALAGRGRAVKFRFRGVDVAPVEPVPRLRLQGRYTASNVTVSNTTGSNTSVSSARTLTFTRDGRYTRSRFVGVSFSHEGAEGRSSGAGHAKDARLTGSYVIEGFRLTLQPDEGPSEDFTVLIETPGPSPGALFINGAAYLKGGD